LRGEAALRVRLPKEAKNSAAISPCERVLPETHSCSSELDRTSTTDELISAKGVEESTGELMQCTRNGNVSVRASLLIVVNDDDIIIQESIGNKKFSLTTRLMN